MARIARVVIPGLPHHVTQRGNRRQKTFFVESDYDAYIDLMAEWCKKYAEGWRGHLFQERFASFPMDESHTYYAGRYIEMNPVRAKMKKLPEHWRYSSCRAHLAKKDDRLVKVKPLYAMVDDWREYLYENEEAGDLIRRHERTGRPLGSSQFVADLEEMTGRELAKKRPGPKPKKRR